MNLDENQKFQVLITELQERYNAAHKIRERSIQFTLWLSGMAVGLGWLLICQKTLGLSQRLALTLLVLALFTGALYFMLGLLRGFRKNRQAMINCERALGMHDSGAFLTDRPLLPKEYSRMNRKWSDHFSTLCAWLILVAMALFILTWAGPGPVKSISSKAKTEQTTNPKWVNGGRDNGKSTK